MSKRLALGTVEAGSGQDDKSWSILGQKIFLKACCDSCFVFEANSAPGDFFPVHIHTAQDKFLAVQKGVLDLKIDGDWCRIKSGEFVRLPRGMAHGFFNRSGSPARALIWVSPAASLMDLFEKLHGLKDVSEIVRLSALHDVKFLPPEANG